MHKKLTTFWAKKLEFPFCHFLKLFAAAAASIFCVRLIIPIMHKTHLARARETSRIEEKFGLKTLVGVFLFEAFSGPVQTCDLERGNFSASDIFFFFTSIVCSVRASLFILMPPLGFEPWTSWLDLLLMLCLRQFGYSATPIEPGCSLFFFFFYLKWIQDSIPLPYKTLILSCYKETSSTVRLSLTNV